jgi:hypothetical protein
LVRRSTVATLGIFAAPAVLAASTLLALSSWAVAMHHPACLYGPLPPHVKVLGEGPIDGHRTWLPVAERCTWATPSGETATTTTYDVRASAGLFGGTAGILTSAVVFVISAKSGDDETQFWKR